MLLKSSKVMVEYAGRRIRWITPCKRSAARGKAVSPASPELRRSSTRYGVERGVVVSIPRAAPIGLQGVIQIQDLRSYS